MRSRFCEWQHSGPRGYSYSDRNSKFSNGNTHFLPSQNVQHMRKPKIALKRYRYVYKRTCYANTKKSSENRPIKHDLGARNKFAYDRVKIPITERRSPDIQRRKPIKYQAGMRSRHSGTRTCRRYGSSWESSR
ncbi:hypothetical protein TNCV_3915961 [Trichonephila clavipes]|nr:hypothetical protein TNCV_168281 [Trichonephila clavipes]GFW07463.1 hypothetical protein TNCV_3915961 [Trichonephila clavipes]